MTDLSYEIVYSSRKTVALSLNKDGALIVRAPFHVSRAVIEDVVFRHREWIADKQQKLAAEKATFPTFGIADGAILPYFGGRLTIRMTEHSELRMSGNELLLPPLVAELELTAWLKARLRPVLEEFVERFSRQMDVQPAGLTVTSAKTRWGSCSPANRLSFSFRLVFCPLEVIEYVVVHELAHIRYKNHGRQFWRQVASILPDYGFRRDFLKQNARLMDILV